MGSAWPRPTGHTPASPSHTHPAQTTPPPTHPPSPPSRSSSTGGRGHAHPKPRPCLAGFGHAPSSRSLPPSTRVGACRPRPPLRPRPPHHLYMTKPPCLIWGEATPPRLKWVELRRATYPPARLRLRPLHTVVTANEVRGAGLVHATPPTTERGVACGSPRPPPALKGAAYRVGELQGALGRTEAEQLVVAGFQADDLIDDVIDLQRGGAGWRKPPKKPRHRCPCAVSSPPGIASSPPAPPRPVRHHRPRELHHRPRPYDITGLPHTAQYHTPVLRG